MSAQPFLVEYEGQIGMNGADVDGEICEVFIFPALDNGDDSGFHEGVPTMKLIREDHLLCFPHEKGLKINFSQNVPKDLISNRIAFYSLHGKSENGDYIVFANGEKPRKYDYKTLSQYSNAKLNTNESGCTKTCAFTTWN